MLKVNVGLEQVNKATVEHTRLLDTATICQLINILQTNS